MKLEQIHSVYFLGVGGIGMSALARWFNANGKKVVGYDKTETTLTQELSSEGISISYVDSLEFLPQDFARKTESVLVVYTPAIPKTSVLYNHFLNEKFDFYKRSEVLGLITRDYYTIAVAGTHGKTTTSSMVSHILKASGRNVMAFIGGILQNYQSNLLLNDSNNNEKPVVVVEADEFDRSFHRLSPDIVILTTVDPDHLDIYHDSAAFVDGFMEFLEKLPKESGQLIVNECVDEAIFKNLNVATQVYGQESTSDLYLKIDSRKANNEEFTLSDGTKFTLGISGIHNCHNALGAIMACRSLGLSDIEISDALISYRGVKRRFEYVVNRKDVVYIDDYAHHPSEIKALLDSVQAIYPGKKITAVFQPHLFSRTRDFIDGFAEQLARVDDLLLLEIYPARELPMEGVTSSALAELIKLDNKIVLDKTSVIAELAKRDIEVLLTIGAGDIDTLVSPIKNLIEKDQLIA
jgi:UDP-N-acetylmuramate--alanine ligase